MQDGPAWQLRQKYRAWLRSGGFTVRLVDGLARLLLRLLQPGPPAFVRESEASVPTPTAPGKLISCPDASYQGKVFYVRNGTRHWVPSGEHLTCYAFSLADTVAVTSEEIRQYNLAGPLPLKWGERAWINPPRTSPGVLREIATSKLRGCGIEFGAGTGPMPVPLDCEVKFADFFSDEQLRDRAYQAQGTDFVPIDYVMGMEEMDALPNASLDFVIACHVIEHLRNPLRALEQAYKKLRRGGQLVLVVPDMHLTFDKERALTSLDHLIMDYKKPDTERDVPHYFEFFAKVNNVPEECLASTVQNAIATNHDLHFHTWTYDSFQAMIEYSRRSVSPWRSVWSQPASDAPDALEFYFVLEK